MFGRILRSTLTPTLRRNLVGGLTPPITAAFVKTGGYTRLATAFAMRALSTQIQKVEKKPFEINDWMSLTSKHESSNIRSIQQFCYTLGIQPTPEHFHKLGQIATQNPDQVDLISKLLHRLSKSNLNFPGQYFDKVLNMALFHKPLFNIVFIVLSCAGIECKIDDIINMRLSHNTIEKLNQIIKEGPEYKFKDFENLISWLLKEQGYLTAGQFEKLAEILPHCCSSRGDTYQVFKNKVFKYLGLPISSIIDLLYKHRDKIMFSSLGKDTKKTNLKKYTNQKLEDRVKIIDLLLRDEFNNGRLLRNCNENIDIIVAAAKSPKRRELYAIYTYWEKKIQLASIIEKECYAEDILKLLKVFDIDRLTDSYHYHYRYQYQDIIIPLILNKASFLKDILKLVEISKRAYTGDIILLLQKAELANDMVRIINQVKDKECKEYVTYFRHGDIETLKKVIVEIDIQTKLGFFTHESPLTFPALRLIADKYEQEAHEKRLKEEEQAQKLQQALHLKEQQQKQSAQNRGLGAVVVFGGLLAYSLYTKQKREPASILGDVPDSNAKGSIVEPGH